MPITTTTPTAAGTDTATPAPRPRRLVRAMAAVLGATMVVGITAGAAGAASYPVPTTKYQPKYTVKALSFKASDESHDDWLGSDEPYWVFSSVGADGTNATKKSQTFGDVDSGDSRSFNAADWCVFRTDCAGAVAPNGIGLSIQLWESDDGSSSETLANTATYFKYAGDIADYAGAPAWVSSAAGYVSKACSWLSSALADDLLGTQTLTISPSTLSTMLPTVGSTYIMPMYFGGLGSSDGADYWLFLQVGRVA